MSAPQREVYEVYAIKYAHHARRAAENFIGGDPHDGPMPLDYFVWLIRAAVAAEKPVSTTTSSPAPRISQTK